jgi:hypothetical protein
MMIQKKFYIKLNFDSKFIKEINNTGFIKCIVSDKIINNWWYVGARINGEIYLIQLYENKCLYSKKDCLNTITILYPHIQQYITHPIEIVEEISNFLQIGDYKFIDNKSTFVPVEFETVCPENCIYVCDRCGVFLENIKKISVGNMTLCSVCVKELCDKIINNINNADTTDLKSAIISRKLLF